MFLEAITIGLIIWAIYFFLLLGLDKRKVKKLLKNYDDKKDLSKQGEQRRNTGGANGKPHRRESAVKGFNESKRGQLFQTATSVSSGSTNSSRRKKKRVNVRRGV